MYKSVLLQIVSIMSKLLTKYTSFTVSLGGIHVGGKMPCQMSDVRCQSSTVFVYELEDVSSHLHLKLKLYDMFHICIFSSPMWTIWCFFRSPLQNKIHITSHTTKQVLERLCHFLHPHLTPGHTIPHWPHMSTKLAVKHNLVIQERLLYRVV